MARLFLAAGMPERIAHVPGYCFRAMRQFELERVPHVISSADPSGQITSIDDVDQIDGQAHVILAWALIALATKGDTGIQDEYDFVATLMNRSSSPPYLSFCTRWRIEPGLVLNTHLEHSREQQYWHAYDFLSQSFVAAALAAMRDVAHRRGDTKNAENWNGRLEVLQANIQAGMTRTFRDQQIYTEMLLPTGRAPAVFPGISWLNLAPVAAGWSGVDGSILEQTIQMWREGASIPWRDTQVTASDWLPDQPGNEIYTKVLGWELAYAAQRKEWTCIRNILRFLEQANGDGLPSEAFIYDATTDQWACRDRGNGEQTAWLCWGLVECRKAVGLCALPCLNGERL